MKIYMIAIFHKQSNKDAYQIACSDNLSEFSFFQRGTIKHFMFLTMRESIRTHDSSSQFSTFEFLDSRYNFRMLFLSDVISKYYVCIVTKSDYSIGVAKRLIHKILSDFLTTVDSSMSYDICKSEDQCLPICGLDDYIKIYDDDTKFASLDKINKDLIDIHDIMKENIEKIIDRGIKLDDLMTKTEQLSKQSLEFRRAAIKLNHCCLGSLFAKLSFGK